MTDAEALALVPGDVVETFPEAELYRPGRHEPYLAEVGRLAAWSSSERTWVYVRRLGQTKRGQRYPLVPREARMLIHPKHKVDRLVANVYADYLDEVGEPVAAELLRQAFPMPTEAK